MTAPADPIAAVVHPDPYPYYAQLAATNGARWHDDLRAWIVADANDVTEVLGDPDCRVRPVAEPVPTALAGTPAGDLFACLARTTEGVGHERARASAVRALADVEPAAIDRVVAQNAADLVRRMTLDDVVSALTVRVMAQLVGMHDLDGAYEHTMALVQGFRSTVAADVDAASAAATALGARTEPHTIGLLIQSAEATAALIGNSIVALMGNAARLDAAASRAALAVVQTTLRDDPPVHNTRRFLAADHVVAGRPMATGDLLVVVLASTAGRFGSGRHACPGSALATMIAAAAVTWFAGPGRALIDGATFSGYRPSVNVRQPAFT